MSGQDGPVARLPSVYADALGAGLRRQLDADPAADLAAVLAGYGGPRH